MADWKIERLGKRHDRVHFDCGQPALTHWLKALATQYDKRNLSRTYVLIQHDEPRVWGCYAISTRHLDFQALPLDRAKGLPRALPLPVALLGRLAVDRGLQGQGLGSVLLADAMRRILGLADTIGILAVMVEAIDEAARQFYLHHDFEPLADDPLHLFVTLDDLRSAGLKPL